MTLRVRILLLALALLPAVLPAADAPAPAVVTDGRCYELRTYVTHPGRLDALHQRFQNHTNRLLEKHGMKLVGFWVPQDARQGAENTLIYVVEHASRAAAEAAWAAFRNDPEWQAVRANSEKDGPIVIKVDAVFMNPTVYSALK